LTPFARNEFDLTYEAPIDALDRAHKTIVRSFFGHGTDSVTRSCRTGFRGKMSDNRAFSAQAWSTYSQAVPFFTARLQGVLIENRDAREVMARLDGEQTLHYVDPPYLISTRSSIQGRSKATHGYRHELSDDDHGELLVFLGQLKGMVLLSGYPDASYDASLPDWRRIEVSALADGARERTEVLWMNPACAKALDAQRMPLFAEVLP
jgi:DNA adenine methylase